VLTNHNKMLKSQTFQQATSLSTSLGGLSHKHELSPRDQCNAKILRGGKQLEGPKRLAKMSICMIEMSWLL